MATLIYPDGSEVEVRADTLKQILDAMGESIVVIVLRDERVIITNLAGLFDGMLPNPEATELTQRKIGGPALLLDHGEWFNVRYNSQPSVDEYDDEGGRCSASMWKFIEKARQAELDADEKGRGSLHDRVLGGMVQQLQLWGEENGVPLLRDEAVGVLMTLFFTRKTKVMTGGIDLEVVSDDEWEHPTKRQDDTG
jgi:hypothetical protein